MTKTMNMFLCATVFLVESICAVEGSVTIDVGEAVMSQGDCYRGVVATVFDCSNVIERLECTLDKEADDSGNRRQIHILLARAKYPEVFSELETTLQKWREREKSSRPIGTRPGFLSGSLLRTFTKKGPENRYVEEYVRDSNRKIVSEPVIHSKEGRPKARQAKRVKVEKYTDAEVEAGISRNAAARQAVLEHFLKFLHEGDAYEQSEMVKLVYELWGPHRKVRGVDLTVTDNVPDAEELIAAVFRNPEAPALARMEAAVSLSNPPPQEFQSFMLNIVTNNVPADVGDMEWTLLNRALYQLKLSGDTNALAVLKSQTNSPSWKLEKIEKTVRSIENRHDSSSVRQHELEL